MPCYVAETAFALLMRAVVSSAELTFVVEALSPLLLLKSTHYLR